MRDPTRQDTILIARERLERTKGWLLMLGCGGVVAGVLAAAEPGIGATVFAMVAGAAFTLGGAVQMLRGLLFHRWRPRVIAFRLASGVTGCVIGIALLAEPHAAVAALGLAAAILLIAHGLSRAVTLVRDGDSRWWLWAVAAGLLAVVVAGILAFGWPETGVWAFGTLGGLALFATGWWLIMLATSADSRTERDLAGKWPPR